MLLPLPLYTTLRRLALICLLAITLHGTSLSQIPRNTHPDYYDEPMKRLLAIATGGYIYGVSQGQIDLDSSMVFACHIFGLNRLLPYNEGYASNSPGSKLIDEGNIKSAEAQLNQLNGENKLQLLAELVNYYIFKPGTDKTDLDSAEYFIDQLHNLSSAQAMHKWHLESLSLLGKWHYQKGEIEKSQKFFAAVVETRMKAHDEIALSGALLNQALHLPLGAPTKLSYLQKSLALCQKHNLKIREIQVLTAMVTEHFRTDWNLAEKELLQILELEKGIGSRHLQYTNDVLSYIYLSRSDYMKGIHHAEEALKSMEATGEVALSSLFYMRMSEGYAHLGKPEEALSWNKRAFEVPKSKETQIFWYKAFFERAGWFLRNSRYDEALKLIHEVEAEYPPLSIFDNMHLASIKGNCYEHLGKVKQADAEYRKFLSFTEKFPPEHIHGELPAAIITIAQFYFNQGDFEKAKLYTRQIASLPQGKKFLHTQGGTHLLFFKLDSIEGNFLSAIRNYQQFIVLKDSVMGISQRKKLDELLVQYESARKDQDIKILTQQGELQEAKLQQSSIVRNIIIAGLAVLLVIVGLLYNQYRSKQKSNDQLQNQQLEISHKNLTLQHLLNEKEWLMKEIHHRVKNNLHTIVSLLESQSAYLGKDALVAVRDSQHRVYAMSLIHQKLYLSDNVTTIDMSVYVKELVSYLSDSFDTGQRIRFQVEIESFELDVAQAIPLGLILNEAITNSIKYAFPDREGLIHISIIEEDDYLLLTIADNGIGLPNDFDKVKTNSLGMKLMKGLSKEIDARFMIESKDGTSITIAFNGDTTAQQKLSFTALKKTSIET